MSTLTLPANSNTTTKTSLLNDIELWRQLNQYAEDLLDIRKPLDRIELAREEEGHNATTVLYLKGGRNLKDEYVTPALYVYFEYPESDVPFLICLEKAITAREFRELLEAKPEWRDQINAAIDKLLFK